jgi:hypothetical protein
MWVADTVVHFLDWEHLLERKSWWLVEYQHEVQVEQNLAVRTKVK